MNLTDVDDRIIQQAVAAGKSLDEYTEVYTQAFLDDAAALRLERPEHVVRATEHIEDMVAAHPAAYRRRPHLRERGLDLLPHRDLPRHTASSRTPISAAFAPARASIPTSTTRRTPATSSSGRRRKEGEPYWDTALGPGRPGWHIECSAMSMKYLGETLDIHAGGVDLTFPHHENEIAQSEAATGKPFARFWLHSEHLMVDGQTMSKSLGNFFTLRDLLEQGFAPEAVRYLLASVPYRKKLNFTMDSLRSAETAIERLRNFKLRLETDKFPEGVNEALLLADAAGDRSFRRGAG